MKDLVVGTISFGPGGYVTKASFAPHRNPTMEYPVSRDWVNIACKRIDCIYNKLDECTVPSVCVIGADGLCLGFKRKNIGPQKND